MSNMSMLLPFRKKGTSIHYLVKREFIAGWDQHPDLCGIAVAVPDEQLDKELESKMKTDMNITFDHSDLIHLGVCAIKRSSDHICNLYAIDLSKRSEVPDKDLGDYLWVSDDTIMESIDPQLLSCYAKLKYLVF